MNAGLVTLYLYGGKQSSDHKRQNMRFSKRNVETVVEHLIGIRPVAKECQEFIQSNFLQPIEARTTMDPIPRESVRNAWANLILSQCKAMQSPAPPITPGELQGILDPLFLQAWTLCPQNEELVDAYTEYLEQTDQPEWKDTVSNLTHRLKAIKSQQADDQ